MPPGLLRTLCSGPLKAACTCTCMHLQKGRSSEPASRAVPVSSQTIRFCALQVCKRRALAAVVRTYTGPIPRPTSCGHFRVRCLAIPVSMQCSVSAGNIRGAAGLFRAIQYGKFQYVRGGVVSAAACQRFACATGNSRRRACSTRRVVAVENKTMHVLTRI